MRNAPIDTDVLIVGGSGGLFLSNECTRRALRWRLIEARSSQSVHSKALAILPRPLEIFDIFPSAMKALRLIKLSGL